MFVHSLHCFYCELIKMNKWQEALLPMEGAPPSRLVVFNLRVATQM